MSPGSTIKRHLLEYSLLDGLWSSVKGLSQGSQDFGILKYARCTAKPMRCTSCANKLSAFKLSAQFLLISIRVAQPMNHLLAVIDGSAENRTLANESALYTGLALAPPFKTS
ncbi:hypothetical protein ACJJTC_000185 [Scirpophaga incertulas]